MMNSIYDNWLEFFWRSRSEAFSVGELLRLAERYDFETVEVITDLEIAFNAARKEALDRERAKRGN